MPRVKGAVARTFGAEQQTDTIPRSKIGLTVKKSGVVIPLMKFETGELYEWLKFRKKSGFPQGEYDEALKYYERIIVTTPSVFVKKVNQKEAINNFCEGWTDEI